MREEGEWRDFVLESRVLCSCRAIIGVFDGMELAGARFLFACVRMSANIVVCVRRLTTGPVVCEVAGNATHRVLVCCVVFLLSPATSQAAQLGSL